MKKLLLLLVCCFVLFALTGCDKAEGTWKFVEKKTELLGFERTLVIGDTDLLGNEITEDYMVVVFNKNGTGTLTQSYLDGSFTFTWVMEEEVINVTGQFVNFEARIEDGYLVFKYDNSTYKLQK